MSTHPASAKGFFQVLAYRVHLTVGVVSVLL